MRKAIDIPDCHYPTEPMLVAPSSPTPKQRLYLSNLDEQRFLRFSIKYLYVFRQAVPVAHLRASLSALLVHYYPLAGRLIMAEPETAIPRLEVDCDGQGAVMAEATIAGVSAEEALEGCSRPNKTWRKLLYRPDPNSTFLGVPPLVIQVTHLSCGGMILCTGINHCLCDGVGTSQFLHAWAHATSNPMSMSSSQPLITPFPFHDRAMLRPREPPQINFPHPEFHGSDPSSTPLPSLDQFLLSQPLTPVSLAFTSSHILHLKKQCTPSIKCTSFEMLAVHVWRAWAKSLELPSTLQIKLLFSVNVRNKIKPNLPQGFYGNGFVLGCAETPVDQLLASSPYYGIRLVQIAKQSLNDSYVRSVIDLLEETRSVPDMSASLVISAWSRLGLEDLDFGSGKPVHMGPLTSEIYCVFAPVVGDSGGTNVIISIPQGAAERFQNYCIKGFELREEKGDIDGVNNGGERYCEIAV